MTGDNDKIGPLPKFGGMPIGFISAALNVAWVLMLLFGAPFQITIVPPIISIVIVVAAFLGDYARRRDGG